MARRLGLAALRRRLEEHSQTPTVALADIRVAVVPTPVPVALWVLEAIAHRRAARSIQVAQFQGLEARRARAPWGLLIAMAWHPTVVKST